MCQPSAAELFHACKTIFGPETRVSMEFLRYIRPIGLKAAYRKRAFETHPDRAKTLGLYPEQLSREFREVRKAYEVLLDFLQHNRHTIVSNPAGNRYRPKRTASRPSPSGYRKNQSASDHFYTGGIPRRHLLFGQYLYYSGAISWMTLIEAISWQRKHRPRIGQIAQQWGLLSSEDIVRVLRSKTVGEKFGECALRMGYITGFEHIALIGKQRRMQRKIGEFFLEKGVIPSATLARMLSSHKAHNTGAFS